MKDLSKVKGTMKFGGKLYRLGDWHPGKRAAQEVANGCRRGNYRARVIRTTHPAGWGVYVNHKLTGV